jgi:IrrE N-terminal-like domain
MTAMLKDYYVEFRREEDIAEIALAWRKAAQNENSAYFNVVEFVETVLRRTLSRGPINIEFFDAPEDQPPAYVTFAPSLTLRVDRELWDLAKLGDPEARFIIAHEIGHLILHNHNAKGFSDDPTARIKFGEKEHSAEWQADTLAAYFLLPTHIVAAFGTIRELAIASGVEEWLACTRFQAVMWSCIRRSAYIRNIARYEGECCENCGNFTLVAVGTALKCETCGKRYDLNFKTRQQT